MGSSRLTQLTIDVNSADEFTLKVIDISFLVQQKLLLLALNLNSLKSAFRQIFRIRNIDCVFPIFFFFVFLILVTKLSVLTQVHFAVRPYTLYLFALETIQILTTFHAHQHLTFGLPREVTLLVV